MTVVQTLGAAQDGFAVFGPLESYDEERFGPLLGVSDSGYAAALVAGAVEESAKLLAGAPAVGNGLILDAERMGSAGEVPVGPDEFDRVAAAALGRTWYTTNVGVRANARFLQARPELHAADLIDDEAGAVQTLAKVFEPFLHAPGGAPRPLTVLLRVAPGSDVGALRPLRAVAEALRQGGMVDPSVHRLGFLAVFDREPEDADVEWAVALVEAAADAGLALVAFDGPLEEAARIRVSVQGILQLFDAPEAQRLLKAGAALDVAVGPRFVLDVGTAARTIWAGLHTARTFGLSAAKYGLTPLTLSEQRRVIADVARWTSGWTAVPAFYADTPLVTDDDVFLGDRVVEAALLWLDMIHDLGVRLVLFDCPDRFAPRIDVTGAPAARRLLRDAPDDTGGAFSLEDVERILVRARKLGVRILWSGGIGPAQALALARQRVAGIFTTSSTALPGPVTPILADDPRLARENAPTRSGVRRVHCLIQAGFVASRLAAAPDLLREIEERIGPVLSAKLETPELTDALARLDEVLVRAWRAVWSE